MAGAGAGGKAVENRFPASEHASQLERAGIWSSPRIGFWKWLWRVLLTEGRFAIGSLFLFAAWLFIGLPLVIYPSERIEYWWLVHWTFALFAATVGLILATAALGYFAYRRSRDKKASISATEQSAEAAAESADARIDYIQILRRHLWPISAIAPDFASWLRLAVVTLLLGAGAIWSISFINAVGIGPDYTLYLAFAAPATDLASYAELVSSSREPPQYSTIKARLVQCERDICMAIPHKPDDLFVDIKIHSAADSVPIILISNVVSSDGCILGANHTPYLSEPTRREENDFKLSLVTDNYRNLLPDGKEQSFFIFSVRKVNDYNKQPDRDIRVICRSTLAPHHDTFTERRLSVWTITERLPVLEVPNMPRYYMRQQFIVDYSALAERDGFRVAGGKPVVGDDDVSEGEARLLPSNNWPMQADVVWRESEFTREVILVIVGGIFGLSGAFLVEAIKQRRPSPSTGAPDRG
jgi:hypothetical protein